MPEVEAGARAQLEVRRRERLHERLQHAATCRRSAGTARRRSRSHSAGHADDRGDVPLLERAGDRVAGQLGQVGDLRAVRQRHQQAGRELEGVVQRQHRQHPVVDAELEDLRQLGHHEGEVAVGQHHPLGLAGRPRGEDQRRERVGALPCAASAAPRSLLDRRGRAARTPRWNGQSLVARPASASARRQRLAALLVADRRR